MDEPAELLTDFFARGQTPIPILQFIVGLLLTAVTAYCVKRVYMGFGQTISNRNTFSNNFVPLSITTMLIITIVKSSLALSLGLVGALSIVRFRSAIKEPEELMFLFVCIAIGLGFGAGQTTVTVIGVAILLGVLIFSRKQSLKSFKTNMMFLTISKEGNKILDAQLIIKIISKYALELDLKRFDQSPSMNEISFVMTFNDSDSLIKLKDELLDYDESLEIRFLDTSKVV